MSQTQVRYYPVGNGSMTLIKLDDPFHTTILIDMCVSSAADDKDEKDVYDAGSDLRKHLERGADRHLHLNLLVHSHGDDDHIHGIQNHFWLGDPDDYATKQGEPEKIIIDEIWSPTRFRKNDTPNYTLGEDAKALRKEIRRRVDKLERKPGNLVHILGANLDEEDKDLPNSIRYGVGTCIHEVAGRNITNFSVEVLGPLEHDEKEDDETFISKNRESLILRIDRKVSGYLSQGRENSLLFGDDAEVDTWERLYEKNQRAHLKYDILLAPHHCSWHSLSHESSEDEDAKVSEKARIALSNCKSGAYIVLSCLSDDDEGDESKKRGRAKARPIYEAMVGQNKVLCTGEHLSGGKPIPIVFWLTSNGVSLEHIPPTKNISVASGATLGEPLPHG